MKNRSIIYFTIILFLSICIITFADWSDDKAVEINVRNQNGGIPDGTGASGVSHSSYIVDVSEGKSTNVETGIGSGQVAQITRDVDLGVFSLDFNICDGIGFTLWDIDGGTNNYHWAAGDQLITTITDNYGQYSGESRVFTITLNNSDVQVIAEEDASLPVQMNSISAIASQEEGITLVWRTESETDCAGFHIWRGEEEEGDYVRVTTSLIDGSGNKSSATEYDFNDQSVQGGILYWYQIEEISTDGNSIFYGPVSIAVNISVPSKYGLSQNYPNPFNPETTFGYQLPEMSDVSIEIYSILGQKIKTWEYVNQPAGEYTITWKGDDEFGRKVSSGIYFLQMKAGTYREMRKMTIMH